MVCLKVIPEEGMVKMEHIAYGAGVCNRPQCKKEVKSLRKHYISCHLDEFYVGFEEKRQRPPDAKIKKRLKKDIIKKIPEKGELLQPEDICSNKGYCDRPQCKVACSKLKLHYITHHLSEDLHPPSEGVVKTSNIPTFAPAYSKEDKNIQLIRVIPREGFVDGKLIYSMDGFCDKLGCQKVYTSLRQHYFQKHDVNKPPRKKLGPKKGGGKTKKDLRIAAVMAKPNKTATPPTIPNYPPVYKINTKKKTKLIRVVPRSGPVDADLVYTFEGFCNKLECQKICKRLKEHYHRCHGKSKKSKLPNGHIKIIPPTGHIDPADITAYEGVCNRPGCERSFKKLREHYEHWHVDGCRDDTIYKVQVHELIKDIPKHGEVEVDKISPGKGRCNRGTCNNKREKTLRRHFRMVHTWNPVKCVHCDRPYKSKEIAEDHMRVMHKNYPKFEPIPLTPEEDAVYKESLQYKKDHPSTKQGERSLAVWQLKEKMEVYYRQLQIPSTPVFQRADWLLEEFRSLFNVPDSRNVIAHSSFISYFNPAAMIPKIVFEIIKKTKQKDLFRSYSFYKDPNIAPISQPITSDYCKSGYHRGHLASAANYHELDLFIPTYYYSNIVPMRPITNWSTRTYLEIHLRKSAQLHGKVIIAHFPILGQNPATLTRGVKIPASIGTIMMYENAFGRHIKAWDIPNDNVHHKYHDCVTNPFDLFRKAKVNFTFPESSFKTISKEPASRRVTRNGGAP